MKYKVGDKVKIKSKEWYDKSKDEYGNVECGDDSFIGAMNVYRGMYAIIKSNDIGYRLNIDNGAFYWTDEMFEDDNVEEGTVVYDPQALLNQISTLTHTLDVLCTTGRAKSANIVEEKIMQLIEKL